MPEIETKVKGNIKFVKWLLLLLAIFVILILSWGVFIVVLREAYAGKIYPNVRIANINVGGFTYEQAKEILKEKEDYLESNGIEFIYQGKKVTVLPTLTSPTDPDLIQSIFSINTEEALKAAYRVGRQSNDFLTNFWSQIQVLLNGKRLGIGYYSRAEEIKNILKSNLEEYETKAQPAGVVFDGDEMRVQKEESGVEFDYDEAIDEMGRQLVEFDFSPVYVVLKPVDSKITEAKVRNNLPLIQNVLEMVPIKLRYAGTQIVRSWQPQAKEREWTIEKNEVKDWLTFGLDNDEVKLIFDHDKVNLFLGEVDQSVYVGAKDAKFEVASSTSGLRVEQFQASQAGQEVDKEATLDELNRLVIGELKNEVDVVLKETPAEIDTEDANSLGVKELVGAGESNYTGSPVNRRHNIKNGAQAIDGLLIKPDEEFSLITALGEIDKETGYLPELVIKGNKTVPEYGGGLCQIGTTLFRAAINAGLPIVERRNHSYRVSYYEPAGTDATIYNPKPDLRFVNDTGDYLLLQTHVFEEDMNLVFEFWGTSDGRITTTTKPVIYNIVAPGPTKYIETEDLKPGEKKCTERAHNGADAYFKRLISWPDGLGREPKEETWESHYVPWREVCLIGVDKLSTSTEELISE